MSSLQVYTQPCFETPPIRQGNVLAEVKQLEHSSNQSETQSVTCILLDIYINITTTPTIQAICTYYFRACVKAHITTIMLTVSILSLP